MQVRSVTSIDVRACYEGSPTRSTGSTGTYSTRTVRMGIELSLFVIRYEGTFVLSYIHTVRKYGNRYARVCIISYLRTK